MLCSVTAGIGSTEPVMCIRRRLRGRSAADVRGVQREVLRFVDRARLAAVGNLRCIRRIGLDGFVAAQLDLLAVHGHAVGVRGLPGHRRGILGEDLVADLAVVQFGRVRGQAGVNLCVDVHRARSLDDSAGAG